MNAPDETLSREWIEYIEEQISQSLVLVYRGETAVQTGFFISRDGLICTCYHSFLSLPGAPQIDWNGRRYPAEMVFSSEAEDLALLSIRENTQPLPIYADEDLAEFSSHRAFSMGFAGLANKDIRVTWRPFHGRLSARAETGFPERLEFLDLGIGPGNSGAPVFDLHSFRVVAYVQRLFSKVQRLGDALTFRVLRRIRPDLAAEWRAVAKEFDQALARLYLQTPFPLDLKCCPENLLSEIVAGRTRHTVKVNWAESNFPAARYTPRLIESEIRSFIETSGSSFLLLAGASGTGKTTLLFQLAQQLVAENYLPVLVQCLELGIRDLLPATNEAALGEAFRNLPPQRLFACCPNKTWVVFFDGLNECTSFSLEAFRSFIEHLHKLSGPSGKQRLKAIISLREEFLREYLPAFYLWQNANRGGPDAGLSTLFYRNDQGQPYLRMNRLNEPRMPGGPTEQELMYEQYRETGLRPLTSFDLLSESFRTQLDLPFVLNLVLRHYAGREIPRRQARLELLNEIYEQLLRSGGIEGETSLEQARTYLEKLALFIFSSRLGASRLLAELQDEPWHQPDLLQRLIGNTTILQRSIDTRSANRRSSIRFGADRTLEFFVAQALWNDWDRKFAGKEPLAQLAELYALLPPGGEGGNFQHLLEAMVSFTDWALTSEPERFSFLVTTMNDASHKAFARGLVHSCFDFLRVNYGFEEAVSSEAQEVQATIQTLLAEQAGHFTDTGGEGLLDYVEYLETAGEYKDAAWLLQHKLCQQAIKSRPDLKVRRELSLALIFLYANDANRTLDYTSRMTLKNLPADLRAKYFFVRGRAYQFNEKYAKAQNAFAKGRQGNSIYAYRCEHQLPFISAMKKSDFAGAAEHLRRLLADNSFQVPREQRLESALLQARFLLQLGRYDEAHTLLLELIATLESRTEPRYRFKLSTAYQTMAEIHYLKFERTAAFEAVTRALVVLKEGSFLLSRASALDVKARILGLLSGSLTEAQDCNELALGAARKAQHRPSARWYLQTRALLTALNGDVAATQMTLAEAGQHNPFESDRSRFILLLARYFAQERIDEAEVRKLRNDFRRRHLGWYPGVLSLVLRTVTKEKTQANDAASLFSEPVDSAGLMASYLYARIASVR